MPLNSQTNPFPPIYNYEQSWEQNVRASLDLLAPGGAAIRAGLKLGIPVSAGQPTTGLLPTLTDGYLVDGDQVIGPYGSKLILAASKNWVNKKLYYGLRGLYYADAPQKPTDALIGSLTTDNAGTPAIVHVGQQYNYGACRFGVRGLVSLARTTKGADQTFFTWTVPQIGLDYVRIAYLQVRVLAQVTAGNDTGDDFVIKTSTDGGASMTIATVAAAGLATNGTTVRATPDDGDGYSWYKASSIAFQYSQTDTATAIVGGLVEVAAILECF